MFANKPEGIRRNSNRRSDEFLFPGLWNFGFPKIRKHYFHVSVIVSDLPMVAILAQVCFSFSPALLTLFDVSLAFPACAFLMWETGGKGRGGLTLSRASPTDSAGGLRQQIPHFVRPRQQIPHFVRPCENEDERVIAIFLYYI